MPGPGRRVEAPGAAESRRARPDRRSMGHSEPLSARRARSAPPAPRAARLALQARAPRSRARAAMNHSPLKTALAYECFQDQDSSTLALPSDQKMKGRRVGPAARAGTGDDDRQAAEVQVLPSRPP